MSSPFAPPAAPVQGERPPLASPLHDPHVVATVVLFALYGLFACGFSTLFPATGVIGALTDPRGGSDLGGEIGTVIILLLEGTCLGGMGALFLAATGGLVSGRKWGWALALVASALWMANLCCMPFGGYCLFALLRKRVRVAYGIG